MQQFLRNSSQKLFSETLKRSQKLKLSKTKISKTKISPQFPPFDLGLTWI